MATGNEIIIETAKQFWAATRSFLTTRPYGMTDDQILSLVNDGSTLISHLMRGLPVWDELTPDEQAKFMTSTIFNLLPAATYAVEQIIEQREEVLPDVIPWP